MYVKIKNEIDRGRLGVDESTPWAALSVGQQREIDEAVAMPRELADQRHMEAQAWIGGLYGLGRGMAKDERRAFTY